MASSESLISITAYLKKEFLITLSSVSCEHTIQQSQCHVSVISDQLQPLMVAEVEAMQLRSLSTGKAGTELSNILPCLCVMFPCP